MAEIEETQRRIAAALSRITAGVEALEAKSANRVSVDEVAALKSALEEEKLLTAQLEERIKGLKDRHAAELSAAETAQVEAQKALGNAQAAALAAQQAADARPSMAAMDAELQNLRTTSEQLRAQSQALREANAANTSAPDLINQTMTAEIDALKAERAADIAEVTAILSALEPMLTDQTEGM